MLTPMQRYEWATGPDGWLTVAGWEALAEDLRYSAAVEASDWSPDMAQKYADRALDCRQRAQRLRVA